MVTQRDIVLAVVAVAISGALTVGLTSRREASVQRESAEAQLERFCTQTPVPRNLEGSCMRWEREREPTHRPPSMEEQKALTLEALLPRCHSDLSKDFC